MKILHIITHYYPQVYGAENFTQHLAERQAKDGHQVWVLTGRWNKNWKSNEKINGVKVCRVEVNKIRYIQTTLAIWPFYKKGCQLLVKHKFDLIHTHIYPGMLVGAKLVKKFKFKFLATIQGGDIGDYQESFGLAGFIFKKIISRALQSADKVHVVSTYLEKELIKMGIDQKKIIMIPNGVDIKRFKIEDLKFKNQERIKIVTTSRLEKKNNLIQLVEVVNKLRQKGHKLTLDIYGTGSLENNLKSEIRNQKSEKFIKLRGYIKQKELAKTLSDCDVFIRLSTVEGFGISFIESMAAGLITIGTKVGGIVDIISDQKNGYLIDLNKNIEIQLEKILKRKSSWSKINKQARKTAEQKFAWPDILKKMDQLYQSI